MTDPVMITRRRLLGAAGAGLVLGSGCTRTAPPTTSVDPLPADQTVFSVTLRPGLAPILVTALAAPSLVVRGDGVLVWAEDDGRPGPVPPAYRTATVDPVAVAGFAAEAEASGLISRDAEYGFVDIYDLPGTAVTLHGSHAPTEVGVYAFAEGFDDRVGWTARRNRRRLRRLIERARSLAAEAEPTAYVPERVAVLELTDRYTTTPATVVWPGPAPASVLAPGRSGGRGASACGMITGTDAATVYAAARTNPGQRWLVDGTVRTLVVNALPLDLDC